MYKENQTIDTAATTKSTVLIQGEPSTGKGTAAKQIHDKSDRAQAPLVTVNCTQQPETLLETELFGFEKGAFAGTVSEKRGKFEQATGSTLVLDEVTDLSPKLQAKVLKVLETGAVERIGAKSGIPIDVRIVATSSKNVAECVAQGKFSEALYNRLCTTQVWMSPLRERSGEIKAIVSTMLGRISSRVGRRISGITEDAVQKLCAYPFPGNLRELEGVLERAALSAHDSLIRGTDVAVDGTASGTASPGYPHQGAGAHSTTWEQEAQWAPGRTLDDIERAVILKSLAFHNGNRTHTARELGISIRTLRNKLNIYRKAGIDV